MIEAVIHGMCSIAFRIHSRESDSTQDLNRHSQVDLYEKHCEQRRLLKKRVLTVEDFQKELEATNRIDINESFPLGDSHVTMNQMAILENLYALSGPQHHWVSRKDLYKALMANRRYFNPIYCIQEELDWDRTVYSGLRNGRLMGMKDTCNSLTNAELLEWCMREQTADEKEINYRPVKWVMEWMDKNSPVKPHDRPEWNLAP